MRSPRHTNLGLTSGVSRHKSPACAVVRALIADGAEKQRSLEAAIQGSSRLSGRYHNTPYKHGYCNSIFLPRRVQLLHPRRALVCAAGLSGTVASLASDSCGGGPPQPADLFWAAGCEFYMCTTRVLLNSKYPPLGQPFLTRPPAKGLSGQRVVARKGRRGLGASAGPELGAASPRL